MKHWIKFLIGLGGSILLSIICSLFKASDWTAGWFSCWGYWVCVSFYEEFIENKYNGKI